MSIYTFTDYLQSLSPAMATLLLRGSAECLDSYNRPRVITPGTAGIGLTWRSDGKGWYLGQEKSLTAGGGSISIVDSGAAPELRATSGTIFWTARKFIASTVDNQHRTICKRDAGGVGFDIRITANNQLSMYDGTSDRTLTSVALYGARTLAVRYVAGSIPGLFVDGVYRVNGSGTITPTNNDADLYLANYYNNALGSRINDYGCFVLFNDAILGRQITPQEIANLNEAYVEVLSVFEPERKIFLPPDPLSITGSAPVVYFAGPKNMAGIVPDLSGNGRDFTITGRLTQRSEKTGKTIHSGYGVGGPTGPLAQTAADAALCPDTWTVSLKCLIRSTGESGGYPFMVDSGGANRCRTYPIAGAFVYYIISYSDGEAVWSFPASLGVNHIISIRHVKSNPANVPVVWVDGKAVTVTTVVPKAGVLPASASPRLTLFNYYSPAAAARAFDGDIEIFRMDSGLLTDAQVRKIYVQHALECRVLAHQTDYAISPAAVAAGGYAGPYRVLSGTHKWHDNGVRRQMLGVAAGYFASRDSSAQAYGAWYCRAMKATDAGVLRVPLVASAPGISFNGYALYLSGTEYVGLAKYSPGEAVFANTAVGAIVVGTEYEFFVTRQSVATSDGAAAGYWTVWIKGGIYATWTALLTGTDNTYTTSNSLVGYVDAGGTIADYQQYPNGGSLLPTELPST